MKKAEDEENPNKKKQKLESKISQEGSFDTPQAGDGRFCCPCKYALLASTQLN
jgi:hypothetical protein